MLRRQCLAFISLMVLGLTIVSSHGVAEIPVAAPLAYDSSGQTWPKAKTSVVRIVCSKRNKTGTGFLHKSGNLITAAHVVEGSLPADIVIITSANKKIGVKQTYSNDEIDLAILVPKERIAGEALPLYQKDTVSLGTQVCTWGYPVGYTGTQPMLSVGYLSGADIVKTPKGKKITRFVINAAFNAGNSGGPLIDVETKSVIGVVCSKIAPLPSDVEEALSILKNYKRGIVLSWTRPSGQKMKKSQAQLVGEVLAYLRSQTQLVIGRAVRLGELKKFLAWQEKTQSN